MFLSVTHKITALCLSKQQHYQKNYAPKEALYSTDRGYI